MAGRTARTLDELLRALAVVPAESVGYHMHREFLAYKFAPIEYPNDFAQWAAKTIGDEILAEKLSSLRVFEHRSLEKLRGEILRLVGEHLIKYPETATRVARPDRAFHFLVARSVIMDCGRTAKNLDEMAKGLAEIESSSLYFHLFETRFTGGQGRENDFAEWLRGGSDCEAIAAKVANVDPYMFSLEQVRRTLTRIFTEAGARS